MIEGRRSGRLDLTTATGRQQARWMAVQAASESGNTSERIKVTPARKMREGKPMGGGLAGHFWVRHLLQPWRSSCGGWLHRRRLDLQPDDNPRRGAGAAGGEPPQPGHQVVAHLGQALGVNVTPASSLASEFGDRRSPRSVAAGVTVRAAPGPPHLPCHGLLPGRGRSEARS